MRFFGIFAPAAKEMIEVAYQYNDSFVMAWDEYADTFGDRATDTETVITDTWDWWSSK